jgi:hypothetical protein
MVMHVYIPLIISGKPKPLKMGTEAIEKPSLLVRSEKK